MSRKSKMTIYREKIAEISNVPLDIFDSIEPNDAIVETVLAAENGDLKAISQIATLLFSTYSTRREPNDAAIYFMRRAVEAGDANSAVNLVTY